MVIVYVLTALSMGGAEKQVLALAERMAHKGHTVTLLVLRPPVSQQWPARLPVIHLQMSKSPWSVLRGLLRARRLLQQLRPEIVHAHSFHSNLVARLLKILSRTPAVVSTIHNVYEGGWNRMALYRLTDSLCAQTTTVSEAVRRRYVRMHAVPEHRCLVITNGIDLKEFAPDADRRAAVRAAMGVTQEFVWLTVGRIVAAKDYPNLLRAFAQVTSAMPQAQLWVAGEGEPQGVCQQSGVRADAPLWPQVRWLGLRRDIPALMDAADGFVLASAWEGMPLVLGEAMAMEKPVVATDAGGSRELVGACGTIVPVKNDQALAAAMLDTMRTSSDDRQQMGRAARARISSQFAIDVRADQWEGLYEQILGGR